ncbi:MAG TPA: LysE family translocator [Rheinheimera sp.]|nr:LysE family translocator [Rheinheimera sp.]
MDVFVAVLFFAFSSTITPGPNNLMMLSSGVNYGVRASLPHFFGICLGFPAMVLVVGLGFDAVFQQLPWLHPLIKWAGIAYLLYLAYVIATTAPRQLQGTDRRPMTFLQAAAFQWVNGKAWIMASGAIAAFSQSAAMTESVLAITFAFLVVAFPCVGLWLTSGAYLRQHLESETAQRWFNRSMGALLVASVVPVVWELLT